MLSDIRPFLTDEVGQLCPAERQVTGHYPDTGYTRYGEVMPRRNMFGQFDEKKVRFTTHPARVVMNEGSLKGPASGEKLADAKAIIWLLNHPRSIAIGEVFQLPGGERLSASRIERRSDGADTLTKVFLT